MMYVYPPVCLWLHVRLAALWRHLLGLYYRLTMVCRNNLGYYSILWVWSNRIEYDRMNNIGWSITPDPTPSGDMLPALLHLICR